MRPAPRAETATSRRQETGGALATLRRSSGPPHDSRTHPKHHPALWRGNAFSLAPFFQQLTAAARIARVGEFEADDAVGAEVPDRAAQLAPGRDNADAIEVTERKRPDRAFGLAHLVVAIGDRDLALVADRLADRRQFVLAGRQGLARPDQQR